MADISDVEQALVESITRALYPKGPSQSSVVGALCRIYRGWPNSATLNTDLNAGTVNVTVAADNDTGRTTTRYLQEWDTVPVQPGIAANVAAQTLTLSGAPAFGDVVGIMIDGTTFAYRIEAGDTSGLVAAKLGQLILASRMAVVRSATIAIPGARSLVARVVCDKTASAEGRRQEKDLRVICWCPAPPVRDAIASAIDGAIEQMSFLQLADATRARIIYRNTTSFDQAQNALLYRRDLVYSVEYATITTVQQPSMVFGASDLNTNITYG
jgi:hypothetical protein